MMEALLALKDKLDALDDKLSEYIGKAEQALTSLRLGVPIQMKLDDEWTLAHCKHNKSWRLVLEGKDGRTMLCDAPRETRALALQKLPELFMTAEDQMREKIAEREETLAQTIEFVSTIKAFMEKR